MTTKLPALRVRIYVGEHLRHEGKPVYEIVVAEARHREIAGATVFKGMMGFGSHRELHTAKILRLAEHLPVCIELVDVPEKIHPLLQWLEGILDHGHATVEPVELSHFQRDV